MPLIIPYYQDLAIGQIVTEESLHHQVRISALKAPADAARDQLASLNSLKRSLEMTIRELQDMDIDTRDLAGSLQHTTEEINAAEEHLKKTSAAAEKALQSLQSAEVPHHYKIASPVDYHKSQIRQQPLSADALRLDAIYIPMSGKENDAVAHGQAVSSFAGECIASLGASFYTHFHSALQRQVQAAVAQRAIAGTLVITITCVHKGAFILAPLVLDVDKAIAAWHAIFPGKEIPAGDEAGIVKIASQAEEDEDTSFKLITGATYASCFVGMIHIPGEPGTLTTEALRAIADTLELQFRTGRWTDTGAGKTGSDTGLFAYHKKILELLPPDAYSTIVSLGASSSAKADTLNQWSQSLANGNASLDNLVAPAGASAPQETATDTRTMMKAMQDYVALCLENSNGIPVSYYLKPVTRAQLAQMWLYREMHRVS